MSIFDKIFGSSSNAEEQSGTFWKKMCSDADLKEAIQNSNSNKVVIFKHSTRCFISKTVLKNFENEVKNTDKKAEFYFLDLLACRDLSNKIAEKFGIRHESPQIIVLENGVAVNNASHQSISMNLV